jgi:hypothetical protein
MQCVCSPYGLPTQVPRPTAPGDPSTPCHDASQVDLFFLFKSDFKFLNLSHYFLLQGSQIGQAPVMLWGGSPAASDVAATSSSWILATPTASLSRFLAPVASRSEF